MTTIGAAGGLPAGARRRAVIRWGALGVLLMAGVRIIKTVDVVETWSASAFAELLGTHVPPGSVVVGYDEFYFYAVERGGSTFRSSRADPWDYSSASLRSAWGDRIRRPAADPDSGRFSALAG